MDFRPCIDIHNGKVKQIVGASLKDEDDSATENFVSERDADFFADFFKEQNIRGGHIVILNSSQSPYYEADKEQAIKALHAFPGGFQIGGGMNDKNAKEFLSYGASHIIVTSFVFHDGIVDFERLRALRDVCGKERIVLDVSAKKHDGEYYVVTDRWKTFTECILDVTLLEKLSPYCDEFLVHAADVEGKAQGVDERLVHILAQWKENPITYAGGVASYDDILTVREAGEGRVHLTIGSALDIYGGKLNFETVLSFFTEV